MGDDLLALLTCSVLLAKRAQKNERETKIARDRGDGAGAGGRNESFVGS